MQNDGDFVDVILLYIYNCCINTASFEIHVLHLKFLTACATGAPSVHARRRTVAVTL